MLVRVTSLGTMKGRIVESEAYYGPGDPASHAHGGPTPRSSIMFDDPGHAYVYFTYGMHYLLNFVTEVHGRAGAVLVRALEPLGGTDLMKTSRPVVDVRNLANGPAKLTQAMSIDLRLNGTDLTKRGELFVTKGESAGAGEIGMSGRIGISRGAEEHLRFFVRGNRFTSR